MLSDQNIHVRRSAKDALIAFNDASLIDTLLFMQLRDTTMLRFHIMDIIGSVGTKETVLALLSLTESTDYRLRGFAHYALSSFKGDYIVANTLKKGLSDNSPFVRMMAANSLMNIRREKNTAKKH